MKKTIATIILITSLFFGVQTTLAGFGITPPYLRSDTLTRGSEYTQEIVLVRGDPIEDLKAEITINVPGATGWISVDLGNEFILPKGEKHVPILVSVRVPETADYGEYTGNIRVRTSSLEKKSGVSIALGAQVDVIIKVVDHIYDFEISRVELLEAEEGYTKWWLDYPGRITFFMYVKNTGNIDVAPTKAVFEIYDRNTNTLLESVENIGKIQTVAPFDTSKVAAYLPTHLPPGGYKVKYAIYKGEEVVRSGDLNLSVLPHGIISGYQPFGFEALSFGDKASIICPIVGVTLLIVGFILWRIITGNRRTRCWMRRKKRVPPPSISHQRNMRRQSALQRKPSSVLRKDPSQGNVIDLSKKR